MKKFYFLSTCSTCKNIIAALNLDASVTFQDIKSKPLTAEQLDALKKLAGSYEALFSKRAQLYKTKNLKNQTLSEIDYKKYLLEHYTFLKRPVLVYDDQIFIGNSKKTVEAATAFIRSHE
jgi:arsenate reductase